MITLEPPKPDDQPDRSTSLQVEILVWVIVICGALSLVSYTARLIYLTWSQ